METVRPRIGQWVETKGGVHGEVLAVTKGADALRAKTELQILVLGPSMMAAIGSDWMRLYYEATVQLDNGRLEVLTPRDVARIYEKD